MTHQPRRSKAVRRQTALQPDTAQLHPPEWLQRLQTSTRRTSVRWSAVFLVLSSFVVGGLNEARTHTPTVDEFVYVPEGLYHLRTGDLGFDTTNPPLMKMALALPLLGMDLTIDTDPRWRDNRTGWAPWMFGTRFMEVNEGRYLDAFFAARLIVLAVGVGLGIMLFWKATTLLSPLAAVAVLVLYGSTPPLLAHSAVATLDVGVTALLFAAFVTLERFTTRKTWMWAFLSGALLGLALAAKAIAALFILLAPILVIVSWRTWDRRGIRQLAARAMAIAMGAWLAIAVAYGFSEFPVPAPFLEGLDFQIASSDAGESPSFLNGQWSQTGWWYYTVIALAVKTPIPTLFLLTLGFVAVWRDRRRQPGGLWIVLPPIVLLYFLSFHYAKGYGIRYLLPAFPFLILLAGRGVDVLLRRRSYGAAAVVLLLTWQVIAAVRVAPHSLAYFNELAGGPDKARHVLLDSNLDWGQDLGRLKVYLQREKIDRIALGYFGHVDPHLYGIAYTFPPATPTPGRYAVSANFLAGYPYAITYAGDRYPRAVPRGVWSWLDRFQPVARIGRSIYVFDITPEAIARLQP